MSYYKRCRESDLKLQSAKKSFSQWKIPNNIILFKQTDKIGRVQLAIYDKTTRRKSFGRQKEILSVGVSLTDLPDYDEFKEKIKPLEKQINSIFQEYSCHSSGVIKKSVDDNLYPFYRERRNAYEEYLCSESWARKRQECLFEQGNKCLDCGADHMDIHHLHYRTLGNECPRTDIVPLCRVCHDARHASGVLTKSAQKNTENQEYHCGDRLQHPIFGAGTMSYYKDNETACIDFDNEGAKFLVMKFARIERE